MDAGRGVDSGDAKGVVQRVRKVGNFHMFAATVSRDRDVAQRRLVDDLLAMFASLRNLSTIFREIAQQNRMSSPPARKKTRIPNNHAPFRTKDSCRFHPFKPVQLKKGKIKGESAASQIAPLVAITPIERRF